MPEMNDLSMDVNSFINNLKNNQSKGYDSNAPTIQKLRMNVPGNQGKVFFIPFMNKKKKEFITFVKGVRELSIYDDETDYNTWHKILPPEMYPGLNAEDQALLNETISLFDRCADSEDGLLSYEVARYKSYALIYAWLIFHYDRSNNHPDNGKTEKKPTLLIYPSTKVSNAILGDIDTKTLARGGDSSWVSQIYNDNREGRIGYVMISFAKGSVGYDVVVTHGYNSELEKIVPADFKLSEDDFKLFNDAVSDFLGKDQSNNSYFNRQRILKIKEELLAVIKDHEKGTITATKVEPIPDGNKPIDQMASKPEEKKESIINTNQSSESHNPPPPPPIPSQENQGGNSGTIFDPLKG